MVTLINPPSKLHYLRNLRSPANLGCAGGCGANKYALGGHPALRGLGRLSAIGDASGAGVPAGTVLAYSASWTKDNWGNLRIGWNDPNGIQAAIQGTLAAKWGIVVDAQQHSTSDVINFSGQGSFVLQVHTVSDYASQDDIRSIIDGEFYNATRTMPMSTIRVVQSVAPNIPGGNPNAVFPPQVAAAIAAAQAGYADAIARGDQTSAAQFAAQIQQLQGGSGSITSWLSNNWGWLAAGVGALLVAREVL